MIEWLETEGRDLEEKFPKKKVEKIQNEQKENFENDEKDLQQLKNEIQEKKSFEKMDTISQDDSVVDDDQIKELLKKKKDKKKNGISAEAYGKYNQLKDFKARVIEKDEQQTKQIEETLKNSFMFQALNSKEKEIVVKAMEIKEYKENDYVIKQGDDGNELFIVYEGELECSKVFQGQEKETFLCKYSKGGLFGELSLLYNTPRAASIKSIKNSVLFCLDRDTFNHIVKTSAVKRREKFEKFLQKIEILKDLDPYERGKLCDALKTQEFKKDDLIIKEGEEGDKFYLIVSGEAVALQGDKIVFEYKENDQNQFFGELALLGDCQRKASIKVTSDIMEVAYLDKKSFQKLLGNIKDILARNQEKYEKYQKS